jgi:hypothetical protein
MPQDYEAKIGDRVERTRTGDVGVVTRIGHPVTDDPTLVEVDFNGHIGVDTWTEWVWIGELTWVQEN